MASEPVHDAERLKELQALPLNRKIQITQTRIIEWYQHYHGNVCVSFSGGKDSTVLLHIARGLYPDIPVVFSNTGLEYPEIQSFVRSCGNVDIVTPTMRFPEVITQYGYPLIAKEVAEAIYYARRIRLQTVNVEREREREQCRVSGQNLTVPEKIAGGVLQGDNPPAASSLRRRVLLGQERMSVQEKSGGGGYTLPPSESKCEERVVSVRTENETETRTRRVPNRDSTDWRDWRRGCL